MIEIPFGLVLWHVVTGILTGMTVYFTGIIILEQKQELEK